MTVNVVGACCGGSGVVVCGNGGVGGVLVRGVFCMDPTVVLLFIMPIMPNAMLCFYLVCKESVRCLYAVTTALGGEECLDGGGQSTRRAKSEEA